MAGTAGFAFQRESHGGSNNPPDYSQEPPFESKDSKSAVMAGTAGFEPANVGVKGRCLTAWRRPPYSFARNSVTLKITRCVRSASQGYMGWVKGLEPSTLGTTIRCSNQLSYTHHIKFAADGNGTPGFEPPAYCLEGSCSIRLSYWRISIPINPFEENGAGDGNRTHVFSLEG